MLGLCLIFFFIVITAIYVPLSQPRLHEINADNFKRKQVRHLTFLFRGLNGMTRTLCNVKSYGIIYPIYVFHILGYVLAMVLTTLAVILLFAFNITIGIVTIVIIIVSVTYMLAYVITIMICIQISKKRSRNKEMLY